MTRTLLPTGFSISSGCLEGDLELVIGSQQRLTTTYLDTFDWRLWRAGLVLVEERGRGGRLVLHEEDHEPYTFPIKDRLRFASDLPQGHLADRVGPLMGLRALIPVGAARVDRRDGRAENADGDIVALLRFEQVTALDLQGSPASEPIATLRLRGDLEPAEFGLTNGLVAAPDHDLDLAATAGCRRPADYSSKLRISLDSDQTADSAVRSILLALIDTIEANVDGTINDLDTEFLHDLRVACRRTRSALSQLKGVLPAATTAEFNAEFKWLGSVTGPLRDLDVYLLELPHYRTLLPTHAAADLEPLEKLITMHRSRALRSVTRALQSTRFTELMANWRRSVAATEPSPAGMTTRTAAEMADRRISKAYRRILKRGRRLGEEPPVDALHRLRIDAKKLRYLLEFFRSLYPAREISNRIKELKQLQDILGGLNDMDVQRNRLADFAGELHTDPAVPTSCILTVGRLAGILEERQEGYRLAFHKAFTEFSGMRVRAAFGRLFGGKGLE